MSDRRKDALEQLRAQAEAAHAAALANPVWSMELPQLRQLAATHKAGTTHKACAN